MTEQDFYQLLEAQPNDGSLRTIFSDWLEDQGRVVDAKGQRWMIEQRKCAHKWAMVDGWCWWCCGRPCELEACLDAEVFDRLDPEISTKVSGMFDPFGEYSTLQAAEQDLIRVLQDLSWNYQ